MNSLFVFPHQDDEIGIFPKIKSFDHIIYITNGFSNSLNGSIRQKESLYFLSKIKNNLSICNIGKNLNIYDGEVINNLFLIEKYLIKYVKKNNIKRIYSPAYEGGHQDHDAIFLVCYKITKKFKLNLYEFPLYNSINKFFGYRVLRYPFFNKEYIKYKLSIFDIKMLFLTPIIFKSQISSFIGIYPFILLLLFSSRSLSFRKINKNYKLPFFNSNDVFYHRRKKFNYSNFLKLQNKYLNYV